jgi:Low affinity iron permease
VGRLLEPGRFFAVCVLLVVVWAPSFFLFGSVDTWQLIINTATTIVTFLLVALLQNTQKRADDAVQHKLNAIADGLATLMGHLSDQHPQLRHDCTELRAAVGLGGPGKRVRLPYDPRISARWADYRRCPRESDAQRGAVEAKGRRPMELSITACHDQQPGTRLAIVGTVQGVAAGRVRSVLAHLTVTRPAGVSWLDEAGLTALVWGYAAAIDYGSTYRVINSQGRVRRVLRATGTLDVLADSDDLGALLVAVLLSTR